MPHLEDLHDDDELALLQYIEKFEAQYKEELSALDPNEDMRGVGIEYMNNVLAAASALNVDIFKSWNLPKWSDAYEVLNDFRLFTKSYTIRMDVRQARLSKSYSVALDADTRARIHNYLTKIRALLERADLDERKKNSLYAKLNAFEADVDRSRTRFDNAMAFIIDAASTAKKVGEGLVPINELLKRISELLGYAKDQEPEIKLPSPLERKRIEGPRGSSQDAVNRDWDEIPF